MPGRPPKVDHVKKTFLAEIKAAEELVSQIQNFKGGINPRDQNKLHPKHVRQVVELAFMGVVASWEEFLELTLVRYIAGAKTESGYSPDPKFGQAPSLQHAYQALSSNPKYDPQKDCLKVSDPKWVTNSADFYFSQHGYAEVKAKSGLLLHASAIRNRVAHSSTKCKDDFKTTSLYFLDPPSGKLRQGYGPGDLLQETAQRHFGQPTIQARKTHFEAFIDLYQTLAGRIVQ